MASDFLEREYIRLRSERVRLRKVVEAIDRAASIDTGKRYGPDGYRNQAARAVAALRATEPRWRELEAMLRKPSGKPVRLNAPVRRQAPRPAVRRATSMGYMTRALRPD